VSTLLLTPGQVARQLQVKERTVSEWLKTGRMRGVRVGRLWRVPEESVQAFLAGASERKPLREYTRRQIEEFLADDVIDAETARKVERILAS